MYNIRQVTLKNGANEKNVLVIDFDDPQMSIVGEFLMADASLIGGKVVQEIDEVINGKISELASNGNRCALMIRPNTTTISDLFNDIEGFDAYPTCQISTEKLRELIIMWFNELNKFQEDK